MMTEHDLPRSGPARLTSIDRSPVRLALFAGGLVLALVAGIGVGQLFGSSGDAAGTTGPMGQAGHAHGTSGSGHDHTGAAAAGGVGGLAVSAGGYTLVPATTTFPAGKASTLRFRVDGPDRRPVTDFAIAHDKPLHLIVVRRDLTGYQHLHPTMGPDGTWSVSLTLPTPGSWRAYADFTAVGASGAQTPVTLGVDLAVAGDYRTVPLPAAARESTVDGLAATYEGTPQVGASAPLVFRVHAQDGSPLTDLERYLGSYGHLVVLREGDLGYVHVHPEPDLLGGAVKFWLAAPSPGSYRMFFDFQRGARVHTAEYTLVVT
ncbi:MAG TPA: hypothetical protein VHI50_10125 [Micromonosporaceae bacterium]|nr:hypothetical protein [Micromonosporaceae bacterium]